MSLYLLIDVFQCGNAMKVVVFAALAISFLLTGLFKCHRGLSFCLVMAGLIAGAQTCFYYTFAQQNLFRLFAVTTMLIILSIALIFVCKSSMSQKGTAGVKVVFGSALEWILAVALFFVVPCFIQVTIDSISPVIDHKEYAQKHDLFFGQKVDCDYEDYTKEHCCKYVEWKKNREMEWKASETFLDYKKQIQHNSALFLLYVGPISFCLLSVGTIFIVPIIGASFIAAGIVLAGMIFFPTYDYSVSCFGINLWLFEFLFLIFGIFVLLQHVYAASQKKE